MQIKNFTPYYFLIIFCFFIYLMVNIAWPFRNAIIFSLIFSGIFYPVMEWLVTKSKWPRHVCSLLICIIISISILLPFTLLIIRLSTELYKFYLQLSGSLTTVWLQNTLSENGFWGGLVNSLSESLGYVLNLDTIKNFVLSNAEKISLYSLSTVNAWVTNIATFLLQFAIMLVLIFSILTEGPKLRAFFLKLTPLNNKDQAILMQKFNQMNYVTLVCNGLGGIAQGILAGAGFWVAGIGSVTLWTVTMSLLAFIPLVGMSFIYVPACIYLLFQGHYLTALFLFIYCSVVALVVENVFKPKFIGQRVKIHSVMLFLSILGGLAFFGMAGIFYGPITIILFLSFVHFFLEHFGSAVEDTTTPQDRQQDS